MFIQASMNNIHKLKSLLNLGHVHVYCDANTGGTQFKQQQQEHLQREYVLSALPLGAQPKIRGRT